MCARARGGRLPLNQIDPLASTHHEGDLCIKPRVRWRIRHSWPTAGAPRAAFDLRHHVGSSEVDGAAAAQGRGVLDEHDLFVVAHALEDLLGLDQPAGELLLAGRPMGGTGAALPTRGGAGAFGDGIAEGGKLAAGLGEKIGRLVVLDMGEQPQVGGIEPGLTALMAPALGELAERLVEQAEVDAVLASGVARGLEDAHVAEPGDLIEQEQNPTAAGTARLVDGVQERAEDDAGGLRTGLEDLERQVDEHVELAGEQVAGAEALATDQAGEGRDGKPRGSVAGFAIEAGELLFGDVLEVAGELGRKAKAITRALGIYRFEQLFEFRYRQRDALAQEQQRLALGRDGRVENQIGEQAAQQRSSSVLEVIVVALAGSLAAQPADDGLKIEQGAIGRCIDPVERVEGIGRWDPRD